jgi:hypothetical protein
MDGKFGSPKGLPLVAISALAKVDFIARFASGNVAVETRPFLSHLQRLVMG